jgi:hypothetical protein
VGQNFALSMNINMVVLSSFYQLSAMLQVVFKFVAKKALERDATHPKICSSQL